MEFRSPRCNPVTVSALPGLSFPSLTPALHTLNTCIHICTYISIQSYLERHVNMHMPTQTQKDKHTRKQTYQPPDNLHKRKSINTSPISTHIHPIQILEANPSHPTHAHYPPLPPSLTNTNALPSSTAPHQPSPPPSLPVYPYTRPPPCDAVIPVLHPDWLMQSPHAIPFMHSPHALALFSAGDDMQVIPPQPACAPPALRRLGRTLAFSDRPCYRGCPSVTLATMLSFIIIITVIISINIIISSSLSLSKYCC